MRRNCTWLAITAAAAILAQTAGAEEIVPAPIRFARGASSATVSGALVLGDRALWAAGARAGQHMSVRVAAKGNDAVFQLYEPGALVRRGDDGIVVDGKPLPGTQDGADARQWDGVLPRPGSYLIVVGGVRGDTDYRLTVSIR